MPDDTMEDIQSPSDDETTAEKISRLLIVSEERGRILAERTALLAEQVKAQSESNKIAQRDVVSREALVDEVHGVNASVCELVDSLKEAMNRQISAAQVNEINGRLILVAQVLGQLVTGIALLGRNDETREQLEVLRADVIGLLAQAVVHDNTDLNVTTVGQVGRDLSGNLAGGNIDKGE